MLEYLKKFWEEEDGIGVVEIALIIIIIVGVAVIFRTEIEKFVRSIFEQITGDAKTEGFLD